MAEYENVPVRYIKDWSDDPTRNRAVVEVGGRTFRLAGTGYKGPTFFLRAWENNREIECVASKKCSTLIRRLQAFVTKEARKQARGI
jgi:hypothetical protein